MKIPLNCKLNKTQKDRHPFGDDLFIFQNAYEILCEFLVIIIH